MKDKIRMILREGVVDRTIKKIAIFDFDGTLIDTDTPESGKPLWLKEFGFEWPFTGWWGRPESLDSRIYFKNNGDKLIEQLTKKLNYDEIEEIIHKGLNKNIFKNETITSTLKDYEQVKDKDTLTVLLTGRHSGVGDLVTSILDSKRITFDDYIYKTGKFSETHVFKEHILNDLVNIYPQIEKLEIWEDRDDHLPIFKRWGGKQSFEVIVHHVTDATK